MNDAVCISYLQLDLSDQELLYKEFAQYAVPSFTLLGRDAFVAMMKPLGWPEHVLPNLFRYANFNSYWLREQTIKWSLLRTFDINNRGGLTYKDILYGLAAIDPGTPHGGPPAEIRCRYIFRYGIFTPEA